MSVNIRKKVSEKGIVEHRVQFEGISTENPFDVDREMIKQVCSEFPVGDLVKEIAKLDTEGRKEKFGAAATELMNRVIELADGKYRDRSFDMIKICSESTGVYFPSLLDRYVEFSLLSSRPQDVWVIAQSNPRGFKLRVIKCSIKDLMIEEGVEDIDAAECRNYCLTCIKKAAEEAGNNISLEMTKTPAKNNLCEFYSQPQ